MPFWLHSYLIGLFVALVALLASIHIWPYSNHSTTTSTILNISTAAMSALKLLTVAPSVKHTATVIFVHGLGDSGHGWKPVADILKADPALQHIKWVLPHAPAKRVTANMGMSMPAWFDIYSFGFDASGQKKEDDKGILETSYELNKLITSEVDAGLDANRIVLGGFSQGGAMTVFTGLSTERKLAGLMVLSGWAAASGTLKPMITDTGKSIPIFWGHGKDDPLVTYKVAEASQAFLRSVGVPEASEIGAKGVSFNGYADLEHSTSPQELQDMSTFLKKVLPAIAD